MTPPVRQITSASNPAIKLIRALEEKKHRRETGLFVAEGLRTALSAEEQGHYPVKLVYSEDLRAHPKLQAYLPRCAKSGTEIIEANRQVMEKISRRDNPQGVIGAYRAQLASLPDLRPESSHTIVGLHMIRDPGNLGTIMRTADAVGAAGIVLIDECCDPFSVEAVRASMGSVFAVRIAKASFADFLAWRRGFGGLLVGTSLRASDDFRRQTYDGPVFLLMGNEQSGLPDACEAACDARVRIPMRGTADSLNVAVATALLLYEINRKLL